MPASSSRNAEMASMICVEVPSSKSDAAAAMAGQASEQSVWLPYHLFAFAGPLEVFAAATARIHEAGYRTEVVSATGGEILTSSGMGITTGPISSVRSPVDTLIITGGDGLAEAFADATFLHHVRRLAAGARRVTSVCIGAFILAEAGLLDGRRATTHWEFANHLANTYPCIDVDPDAIYVRDGKVWTSAGVTSGIDLAVAGRRPRTTGCRHRRSSLVVYLRRSE